MGRYDLPEPKCKHMNTTVRVSNYRDKAPDTGPLASVWVCSREECVEDAKQWVKASTGQEAITRK